LFEQRRHELFVSVPAEGLLVDVDETRLAQMIEHLLTNAALYTPPGGRIEVTAERAGGSVVLRVRDNGIGIDPERLPSLFDMFVQGEGGRDRSGGGLGLGLSLVRMLTMLHGGMVSAESDGVGHGSVFTLQLPAAVPSARSSESRIRVAPTASAARGRRILVVDDNRDGAEMISALLEEAGHDVRIATDPLQALALATAFQPEVAILDIGLPVMDGDLLARELRSQLGDATPILIALTGHVRDKDKRKSDDAGFSAHLVKPIDAERLVKLLDMLSSRPR
jgi:CheY-like chemotaxis protein